MIYRHYWINVTKERPIFNFVLNQVVFALGGGSPARTARQASIEHFTLVKAAWTVGP
jgi:hypothetical protein